jgi:hypothetical protein
LGRKAHLRANAANIAVSRSERSGFFEMPYRKQFLLGVAMDLADLAFVAAIAGLWLVAHAAVIGCVKLGEQL